MVCGYYMRVGRGYGNVALSECDWVWRRFHTGRQNRWPEWYQRQEVYRQSLLLLSWRVLVPCPPWRSRNTYERFFFSSGTDSPKNTRSGLSWNQSFCQLYAKPTSSLVPFSPLFPRADMSDTQARQNHHKTGLPVQSIL